MVCKIGEQWPRTHYVAEQVQIEPLDLTILRSIDRPQYEVTEWGDEYRKYLPGTVTVTLASGDRRYFDDQSEYVFASSGGGPAYRLAAYGCAWVQSEEEHKQQLSDFYDWMNSD